ncbi:hypothetical protein J6590_015998 [Homalodisca vitripennis]|nr:hypothetical protein J6590_015998 [Homalodisca vitripennis]
MFSPSLILVFLSISSIGERVAFYQRCVASADLTVDERKCARILIPARGSIVLSRSFSAGSRLAYSGTDTVAGATALAGEMSRGRVQAAPAKRKDVATDSPLQFAPQ